MPGFTAALTAIAGCWLLAAEPSASAVAVHESLRVDSGRFVLGPESAPENIERVTDYCLGCHEGFGETATGYNSGTQTKQVAPRALARNHHPVDRSYPRGDAEYVGLEALDERMLLTDGRITCLTCHSHDAPDHRLRIPTDRGELCLACHAK